MAKGKILIPKEDLQTINDSFKTNNNVATIAKDGAGKFIRSERKQINKKSYAINDFRGRKLKHDKFVIPAGGKQTVIALKGDLFDNIIEEKRSLVPWFESDFV